MPVVQDILVVGGGSRIAQALEPLLGEQARYAVRRAPGRANHVVVADYGTPPASALEGIRCIVNCAGISTGDARTLDAVNAELPRRLGEAARAAGVRQLIHISSFSVYGGAQVISRHTPERPTSAYGRSKLAGDRALRAIADDDLAVTILRLPLIYGANVAGKLAQLLRLWTRAGILPVPSDDVNRAMIGVDLSAQVVARLARAPADRTADVVFAADPRPFTYADARRARAAGGARNLRCLPVPRTLTTLVQRMSPAIGGRLFADSRLDDGDNLAIRFGLPSRLYDDIAAANLRTQDL